MIHLLLIASLAITNPAEPVKENKLPPEAEQALRAPGPSLSKRSCSITRSRALMKTSTCAPRARSDTYRVLVVLAPSGA